MGEAAREGGKEEAGVRPELTELKIESIFRRKLNEARQLPIRSWRKRIFE
jgi:hypothetical protein